MHVDSGATGECEGRLPELGWSEIRDPGCYLHIRSGLVLRIYPDELDPKRLLGAGDGSRLARLSPVPGLPLPQLRAIARLNGYAIQF